jgi:hypothetical protein
MMACLALCACGSDSDTPPDPPTPPDPIGCSSDQISKLDGSCFSPGVPAGECGLGFQTDEAGGCLPILPPEACGEGELAVPGDLECRPIAACGDGPWGDIPVEGNTQFVDAAYGLSDSDGTSDKPWTTITAAVNAADPGAIVAIASGSYQENILINFKPVRLWGRCPALVEVVGTPPSLAAIDIRASHSEVRHLAVRTAPSAPAPPTMPGVSSTGAQGLVLEGLWIHDTSGRGINTEDTLGPSEVVVQGSLVERCGEGGVLALGAKMTLAGSVVRDTLPNGTVNTRGVSAELNLNTNNRGETAIVGSVVEGNHEVGVLASGSTITVDHSLVRGTLLKADGTRGIGIMIQDYPAGAARAEITGSVLDHNRLAAIVASGGDTWVTHSVVARSESQTADGRYGRGITCEPSFATGARGQLDVAKSLVEGNQEAGIAIFACDANVEATIVRDTLPRTSDSTRGRGINVQSEADGGRGQAWIRDTIVSDNTSIGILAYGSDITLDSAVVRNTKPLPDGRFGDGLLAMNDANFSITTIEILANGRAGVANFGSTMQLQQARFECNPIQLNGEELNLPFRFTDEGGNTCGCDGQVDDCHVQSSQLEPPGNVDPAP